MSRGRRSKGLQFGKPLALPTSTRLVRCYGKHGKGFAHSPPEGVPLELVLVDAERATRVVAGHCENTHSLVAESQPDARWRVLGWRMADGSLPFGELDVIDPELAQFEFLGWPGACDLRPPTAPR